MREQLQLTAKIVHPSVFEAATINIINGGALLTAEVVAVKLFKISSHGSKRKASKEDYSTQILRADPTKRSKHGGDGCDITYSERLKQLPQTLNAIERLLLQCELVLTPQRTCMLPATVSFITKLMQFRMLPFIL
ncbi:hypothetical protein PPTG_02387 [Phytophthora nicotianae INRA-310]|uniref:Uncharacterized protein n=1 Tax=Phytophthora nicotianae (strain INRA-310) TaxID=761204 RepID=W2RD32_PHYN3|nr:hypothetical protein PPTG_02387 [Phytophthora nicotianae INRA-310]ETN22455.1 hypothetical protein PPTG_02387 [Phytophthora nicotianae INRA-310]